MSMSGALAPTPLGPGSCSGAKTPKGCGWQTQTVQWTVCAWRRAGPLARRGLQGPAGEHIEPSEVGTPQGGPLSPLLANILLDQLDRELQRRGHRFVRYTDDMIILVKSERAAQRVMRSIKRYLETSGVRACATGKRSFSGD